MKKRIGKIIKARRKELGLTQKDLEDFSGVSYVNISDIENGKNCTINSLMKVLEPLGLTLEVIVENKL